ncbi:hypothetical protein B7486_09535 [cyanobacterium TDX16]|nr:hypothetical protein B7486_09535 [cyanobacterium TDX16]
MNIRDTRKHMKKQPFEPFRIHVSDGSSYDVPHPDFILVTVSDVMVGLGRSQEDIPERSVFVDPLHITRIEPISKRPDTNGRKKSP